MYEDHAPWGELEHAYGTAEKIPGLFERISAGKAKDVEKLGNWIAHQGWLSPEVALACVGPVVDLVGRTRGATRAALLRLLADLACVGDHEHFLGTGMSDDHPVGGMLAEPTLGAVREAVVAAAPGLAEHLADRSAPVRGSTALLLAASGTGLDALLTRLAKEKKGQARADMLVALGWLVDGALPDPLVADRTHVAPEVRAGACIGSAYAGVLDDDVAEGLLDAVAQEPLKGSAWKKGDLSGHAVDALRHAAQAHDRPELMVQAFQRVDSLTRSKLGATLVKTVFADEIEALRRAAKRSTLTAAEAPPPLAELTPEQRSLLELLSGFDSGWGHNCDQRYWLEKLGFPQFPPALKVYLEHPPPPPDALDHPFEWNGAPRSLRSLAPEVCVEGNSDVLVEVAATFAEGVEPEQLVAAAELLCQLALLETPHTWANVELATRILVQPGPSMVRTLTALVGGFQEHGTPGFWNLQGGRNGNVHYTAACVGALEALAPGLEVRAVPYSRLYISWKDEHLEQIGSEVRGWLKRGIANNTRQ